MVCSQNSISGRITDSLQVPVPYPVVALERTGDSTIIQGTLGDDNGVFIFNNVKSGNYFLKISATGYAVAWSDSFHFDSLQSYVSHDISLRKSVLLDAVTISSITPTVEFKNGNVTVNVENSPLARGNSVYDLLFTLPGVSVTNNNITLLGKTGVIIMIDGRVQHMSNDQVLNILKGMSAATIQKIEVLKNPPVKYDAAGTSGMINIVTKKNQQKGFNGSAYTEISQGIYNQASYGLALNYKNEKISIFTSVDRTYNTYLINTEFYRTIEIDSGNTALGSQNEYKILEAGLAMKIGADWYLNKSNIIGFKIDGGPGVFNEKGNGKNQISGYNNTGFENYLFSEDGHNTWTILNYNLNAEHLFDTIGTVLNFSADYTDLGGRDMSLYENHFYDANENEIQNPNIFQSKNKSGTQLFSSRFDFIHPMDTASSIEAGLKGSYANQSNEFLIERKDIATSSFYMDTALSSNYLYKEQNLAAYFNYSKSFKTFSLQLGLRGENTTIKGSNGGNVSLFTKNYFSLFPNFSFEYSKAEDHVFQLNLNRRIDRPGFDDLNPFIVFLDQYSYFKGNPFLQPAFSNTAEFTYSFKGIINNSISASRINGYILEVTAQDDSSKILFANSENIAFNNAFAYLLFVKYDPARWYEITLNANISYLDYKGIIAGVPFRSNALAYNANLSNTFLLPGKTKMEISALYRGPYLDGIVTIDPLWSMSFSIQKSFFKEKMDCTIGFRDVFKTFKFHTYSQFDNQNWNFYQASDSRRISFSMSYNFGRLKSEEREINSNEEEKERLNR